MYRYVYGDKDVFRLGFALSSQHHSYYQVSKTKHQLSFGNRRRGHLNLLEHLNGY